MPSVPKILLASQSPRRRQLLENLGIRFTVETPTAEESHPEVDGVVEVTLENSRLKAASVLDRLDNPAGIVLGADTLVVLGNEVIGKPSSPESAVMSLKKLSGKTHEVVTGLTLLSPRFGVRQSATKSRVRFRPLSDAEIIDYTGTREPYDKAGAYAVQGLGALFIDGIEGSYTNVMGLPIETLLREMAALTQIPVHHWFLK